MNQLDDVLCPPPPPVVPPAGSAVGGGPSRSWEGPAGTNPLGKNTMCRKKPIVDSKKWPANLLGLEWRSLRVFSSPPYSPRHARPAAATKIRCNLEGSPKVQWEECAPKCHFQRPEFRDLLPAVRFARSKTWKGGGNDNLSRIRSMSWSRSHSGNDLTQNL
jgi:hypothetical protein